MQKDVKFYLGIDVSKLWFDISLMVVINHQKQKRYFPDHELFHKNYFLTKL